MNPFFQAMDQGYSEEDILSYLYKAIPKISKPIQNASKMGYNAKQIIGYLSRIMNPEQRDLKGKSESEIHNLNAQHDLEKTRRGLSMATAAVAAPFAVSAASSALSRSLPSNLKNLSHQFAGNFAQDTASSSDNFPVASSEDLSDAVNHNTNMKGQFQQLDQQVTTSQQPPLGSGNANIQQPSNIQQSKGLDTNIIKNGLAYKRQIDALIKSGNGPEEIEAYLKKFNPGFIKTIEKEGKGPFKDVVAQYMQEKLRDEAMQPEGSIPNDQIKQEAKPLQEPIEQLREQENPKIEKNSVVSSPNGIGEIREIRNGVGLVEVDGKIHKVKEEDLEASPIPEKDLADLYDDLISGMEKETGEDVSRMVQWAGYNPETNTLQFLPHSGKLYKYSDISPEDAALLTDILSTRKTTGANFIGAWKAGSKSPIGAALSKLIRKLQSERGGKGEEYEETHEPIYSAYEPAIEAKKRKKKNK